MKDEDRQKRKHINRGTILQTEWQIQGKNKTFSRSRTNCLKQKKGDTKFKIQRCSKLNLSQKFAGRKEGIIQSSRERKGLKTVIIRVSTGNLDSVPCQAGSRCGDAGR